MEGEGLGLAPTAFCVVAVGLPRLMGAISGMTCVSCAGGARLRPATGGGEEACGEVGGSC